MRQENWGPKKLSGPSNAYQGTKGWGKKTKHLKYIFLFLKLYFVTVLAETHSGLSFQSVKSLL